jgi:hypothetical protein
MNLPGETLTGAVTVANGVKMFQLNEESRIAGARLTAAT